MPTRLFSLVPALLAVLTAGAQDIRYGDLYYALADAEARTVAVVRHASYTDLTDLVVPDHIEHDGHVYRVTALDTEAFAECTALRRITLPAGLTHIGSSAFHGCSSLSAIDLPNALQSLGSTAFADCSALTTIVLPMGITAIGDHTFDGCTALRRITLPDALTTIGRAAFSLCRSLADLSLPDALTTIEQSAFQYCSALADLSLPAALASLGTAACYGCTALQRVTSLATTPPTLGEETFGGIPTEAVLYVHADHLDAYRASDWHACFSDILPLDETAIEDVDTHAEDCNTPRKLLRNGHLLILRGDNVYDTTGKIVE